ncbi:M20/M25/M40 family metallo-hydrolase [Paenibacillus mendelii]|uniref:M20/M25/M40 family metallo-hydrolase n=1 Tax=Paenibacillus mendelii TaxID=206163 RepID=A0ABV6J4L5_9BACL|nr:M20/M25/M40 family metallo-hydrolase [Paenibacillus mendelii]MCQ6560476.1 M20/M25/M40 family metallo-hydrolase [Paenibacillus mendelii]
MKHAEAEIREWVEKNEESMIRLVQDLVSFNTVNRVWTGTEKDAQLFLSQVLRDMGLEVDVFTPEEVPGFKEHPGYFPGKDYSDRPNVVAEWKGTGGGQSLIFSSHMDTTTAASGWDRDPWAAHIEDGKLYGLGTFDMKGGLVASISAVRCLKELGFQLQGDVLVESVVDEEFGGANGTLASRIRGYNPDAAIIPEPTNMSVCPGNHGGAQWRVTFTGNTGMSFSGETIINPANIAAKFIVYLEEFEAERQKKGGPAPYFIHDHVLPVIVTRLEAGDMNAPLCDTGPAECHVDLWVECHAGVTEEELEKELVNGFQRKYADEYMKWNKPTFRKLIRFLPGTQVDSKFPLIGLLSEIAGEATDGKYGSITGAPFACDSFMFNQYTNTPAIIMGPVGANAHAPDEYIDIPAFLKLVEIYARTIVQWCGYLDRDGLTT